MQEGFSNEFGLPCVEGVDGNSFVPLEVMRFAREIGAVCVYGGDNCYIVNMGQGPQPFNGAALRASARENRTMATKVNGSYVGCRVKIEYCFPTFTWCYFAKVLEQDGKALKLTEICDGKGEALKISIVDVVITDVAKVELIS